MSRCPRLAFRLASAALLFAVIPLSGCAENSQPPAEKTPPESPPADSTFTATKTRAVIRVTIESPGYAPQELELDLGKKLSETLASVDQVKFAIAHCTAGNCSVDVYLEDGADSSRVLRDLRATLNQMILPPICEDPWLWPVTQGQEPQLLLSFESGLDDDSTGLPLVSRELFARLRAEVGVAEIQWIAESRSVVRVALDVDAMAKENVSIIDMQRALFHRERDAFGATAVVDQLNKTKVSTAGEDSIRLSDVAKVSIDDGAQHLAVSNGRAAIVLGVWTNETADVDALYDSIRSEDFREAANLEENARFVVRRFDHPKIDDGAGSNEDVSVAWLRVVPPPGTREEVLGRIRNEIQKGLAELDSLDDVLIFREPNETSAPAYAARVEIRATDQTDQQDWMKRVVDQIDLPGCLVFVETPGEREARRCLTGSVGLVLTGPDRDLLGQWATTVWKQLNKQSAGFRVDVTGSDSLPAILVSVDQPRAAEFGLAERDLMGIRQFLARLVNRPEDGLIAVELGAEPRDWISSIGKLQVPASDGELVSVTQFVDLTMVSEPSALLNLDGTPAVVISGHGPLGESPEKVREMVDRIAAETRQHLGLADEFKFRATGE